MRTYELQALFSDSSCKLREKRYFLAIKNVQAIELYKLRYEKYES
jgi:hypothetical protein